MHFRNLRNLIVLILIFLIISGCNKAANQESQSFAVTVDDINEVESTHEWNINFSSEVDETTANDSNISVIDEGGNAEKISVFINSDKKSIIVKPPADGYKEGKHTLEISKNVKSSEGLTFIEEFTREFTVLPAKLKDEVTEPKDDFYKEKFALLVGEKQQEENILFADYVNVINNGYPELLVVQGTFFPNTTSVYSFDGTQVKQDFKTTLEKIEGDYVTLLINKLKGTEQFNFILKSSQGAVNGTNGTDDYLIFEHTKNGSFKETQYGYSFAYDLDYEGRPTSNKEEERTGDINLQYLETISGASNHFEDEDVIRIVDIYNRDNTKNKTLVELLTLAEQLNPDFVFTPEGYLKKLKTISSKGMLLDNGIVLGQSLENVIKKHGIPKLHSNIEGADYFEYSEFGVLFVATNYEVDFNNLEEIANGNKDAEILKLSIWKYPQLSFDTVKKVLGNPRSNNYEPEFSDERTISYTVGKYNLTFHFIENQFASPQYITLSLPKE
ncbi:DUF4309 domain-containing protein [Schinkia azotoformans]|uniref:hypothetical protein n=1 Tax=Schinkia azotoformans TaxID=1454 RepID=UPI002E24103D|nr:DUF4309 domain-containing protein [Schinkia azotoformans]